MGRLQVSTTRESRFEALYDQCYGRVLGYVLRRASAEVAADVVADVFLVAWRRLDQIPEEPLPWLLGVARRTLANERRGGRRRAALAEVLVEKRSDPSQAALAIGEEKQVLIDAVARLTETDRELVRLIAWEGLTTREAAKVLGISHSACRVRLHRVRRRLAKEMADPTEGTLDTVVYFFDAREEA
jgi:RNA polymerase sigma-70 factor, ECF subfamily